MLKKITNRPHEINLLTLLPESMPSGRSELTETLTGSGATVWDDDDVNA
jgi:hypothetical protein